MAIEVRIIGVLSLDVPGLVTVDPGDAAWLSLRRLIYEHLARQVDARLPALLLDAQGQIRPGYAILVDGRNALQLGGLDCLVRDGAAVLITAEVAGG